MMVDRNRAESQQQGTSSRAAKIQKFKETMFIRGQNVIPQHLLSSLMYKLTRSEIPGLRRFLIQQAIQRFDIDMSIAESPDLDHYASFNAFFTRALREGVRPVTPDPKGLACPCDALVSQLGKIQNGRILQAKGQDFSVMELLADDAEWEKAFAGGSFATLYLSPRDYHRVHMPLDGVLKRTIHVPGKLFSVNALTAREVPRLYARNERLCCFFETQAGPMALVMVGAIFVSSIETVWGGELESPSDIQPYEFKPPALTFSATKGQEIGRFNMGSTVILLFGKDRIHWSEKLRRGMRVRMGQRLAGIAATE